MYRTIVAQATSTDILRLRHYHTKTGGNRTVHDQMRSSLYEELPGVCFM